MNELLECLSITIRFNQCFMRNLPQDVQGGQKFEVRGAVFKRDGNSLPHACGRERQGHRSGSSGAW